VSVKIVTDSTSDISNELAKELGITVVPLTVSFGRESFLDQVEMTTGEFYKRLAEEDIFPTTTQPPPATFADVFSRLCKESSEILTLTISSRLSGTYQSAINAKNMVESPDCRIEVIDSTKVTMACGLIAIVAARAAKAGAKLDEVVKLVKAKIPRSHSAIYFETLKYLAKGGRIGKAQGFLGSMLSIKPVLTIKDGEITPLTRLRSRAAGIEYLYNFATGFSKIEELAVEDCNTPEDANELVKRLSRVLPGKKIFRASVSPVLGTYAGPGALAVTVLEPNG
jgi:DegV family protein with EDD domain